LATFAGKSMLHLQCHFGLDTMAWARLGAETSPGSIFPSAIATRALDKR